MKTIAEAHRIARAHRGGQKELRGAEIQLAPSPRDLLWQNITMDGSEKSRKTIIGFVIIGVVCFFNTIPLIFVSLLANLSAVSIHFLLREIGRVDPDRKFPLLVDIVDFVRPLLLKMEECWSMGKLVGRSSLFRLAANFWLIFWFATV